MAGGSGDVQKYLRSVKSQATKLRSRIEKLEEAVARDPELRNNKEKVMSDCQTIFTQMRDLRDANVDVLEHNIYCPVMATENPNHSESFSSSFVADG